MSKDWEITGRARVCGVIGDPVEHSVSPAMQNAAFRALKLDFAYVPFSVKKEGLARAIDGVRTLNIRGLNVTIPHKVDIIPLLDEIDSQAHQIGAVNTIVNDSGRLKGYNTDAEGFVCALLRQGIEPEGKTVVVLGAGGASRAICFALAAEGANLIILNRTPERAAAAAGEISGASGQRVEVMGLEPRNLSEALEKGQIVVNATSVGMLPHTSATLIPAALIRPHHVVVDIVYNPLKTKLLAEAGKAGARTLGGLEMLVWQGALAFEKWTGAEAPVDIMRKEAGRALSAHEK